MLRAIVWKEFREQGLIGLTLLAFGTAILVAVATLADPASQSAGSAEVVRFLGGGLLATMMLAVTAGTVCGGALFAAEREAGTMGFLESLPVSRWRMWRAKLAAGAILAGAQIAIVLWVAVTLGLVETVGWAFAIAVFSLLAFVWGVYGSTHARTTLGSVGVAVPAGTGALLLFFVPLWALYGDQRTNMLSDNSAMVFLALMFFTPLIGSAMRFTRLDRQRTEDDPAPRQVEKPAAAARESAGPPPDPFAGTRSRIGITALLWLSGRQLLKPGLVIAAFALVSGLGLLPDNLHPILLWPSLGLTAGVLAGVTAFMDEQSSGSARYWGERRLPVGRLQAVKLVVHALFALVLGVLILLPAAIRAETAGSSMLRGESILGSTFRSLLFDSMQLGSQSWKLVFLPIAYGFAAGQLCAMLFKKAVVAAGVAGIVGGSLGAFWLPSLLSGGTHHWQIWAVPILAVVIARLLLRAWSSEGMTTRRPIGMLAGGLVLILLFQGAALGWRVLEVPDEPGSEDDTAYVASLPPLEVLDAGRQFRSAAERFARTTQGIPSTRPAGPAQGSVEDRISVLPYRGWPVSESDSVRSGLLSSDPAVRANTVDKLRARKGAATIDPKEFLKTLDDLAGGDPARQQAARAALDAAVGEPYRREVEQGLKDTDALTNWLDKAYSLDVAGGPDDESWYVQAANAGRDPAGGIFEHPLRTGTTASLQRQARGDDAGFVEELRTALALARTFRQGSITISLGYGNEVARAACAATDRWLASYRGPPAPLAAALRLWREDDTAAPFDPKPHLMAERYVLRELAKAPAQFLPAQLTPPGRDREQYAAIVDLVGVMWNTPWERERTRRLSGLGFERGEPNEWMKSLVRGRPGSGIFTTRKQTPDEMIENDRQLRVSRRAVILMLALRLHVLETGSVPASLDDLVRAGRLAAVPIDPYSDEPFRYRISEGETLQPPPQPLPLPTGGSRPTPGFEPRSISAGQPVFWSVGMNRTDEGGRTAPTPPGATRGGADIVYLPILPAK